MLKTIALIFLGLLTLAGAALAALGKLPAIHLVLIPGLLILAIVYEKVFYIRKPPASAQLESTGERFIDPASGQPTEVTYDPATGERYYNQQD